MPACDVSEMNEAEYINMDKNFIDTNMLRIIFY